MKHLFILLACLSVWCGLPTQTTACPVATNIRVDRLWPNSIPVLFTPAPGVNRYAVQLFQGGSRVTTSYATYGSVVFHLLLPATTYTVRVGSICSPGDTTYAAPISATTDAGSIVCPYVTNITLGQVTGTQATVGFTAASGGTSYLVSYQSLADTTNVQGLTVSGPPAVLTNLLPNTPYRVRISTKCGAAYGLTSAPYIVQTTAGATCSSASNLAVAAAGSTSATVSFTPGTGISSYRVAYRAAGDPTQYYASGISSPITLSNLLPGQTYYVQLQSKCDNSPQDIYTTVGVVPFGFRSTGALSSRNALGLGTVEAYPNPARGLLTVQLPPVPGATAARLLLLNSLGQLVRTRAVALATDGTRTQLDLSGLAAGLYTLRVEAAGHHAAYHLAVE